MWVVGQMQANSSHDPIEFYSKLGRDTICTMHVQNVIGSFSVQAIGEVSSCNEWHNIRDDWKSELFEFFDCAVLKVCRTCNLYFHSYYLHQTKLYNVWFLVESWTNGTVSRWGWTKWTSWRTNDKASWLICRWCLCD